MITAKNLQLLDTQGNNISPAVNIETIYYELTVGNVVHRNHIFKHFPVYVKYNGRPTTGYTGIPLLDDTFYQDTILPYETDQTWPGLADVYRSEIVKDPSVFDSSLGGTVRLQEYSTQDPNDIYIAGIRQTPLGNGTDFMRLDISTYNLSEILEPVAYKDWVNLRLDYYNTKIENNNIYRSKLRNSVNRQQLTTLNRVGALSKTTSFDSSLNGLTYNEIFDKIFLGPTNPTLSDFIINLTISDKIYVTENALINYHTDVISGIKTYTYNNVTSSVNLSYNITLDSVQYPGWTGFTMNGEKLQLPEFINRLRFGTSTQASNVLEDTVTSSTITISKNIVRIAVPWSLKKLGKKLQVTDLTPYIEYNIVSEDNPVKNSIGNAVTDYTNAIGINNAIKNTKPNVIINVNNTLVAKRTLPEITFNSSGVYMVGWEKLFSDNNVLYNKIDVMYPIKYGSSLNSLVRTYVKANTFNKIAAYWNPVKTFYVCIPRILACQMVNPVPELHRIFQGSKWQITNDWVIDKVVATGNTQYKDAETGKTVSLEPYIVYQINPVGCGATRHILFTVNLGAANLLANRAAVANAKTTEQPTMLTTTW